MKSILVILSILLPTVVFLELFWMGTLKLLQLLLQLLHCNQWLMEVAVQCLRQMSWRHFKEESKFIECVSLIVVVMYLLWSSSDINFLCNFSYVRSCSTEYFFLFDGNRPCISSLKHCICLRILVLRSDFLVFLFWPP